MVSKNYSYLKSNKYIKYHNTNLINSDYPDCNVLDYLNFFCNKCNKNLCKEHYHNPIDCPFTDKINTNQTNNTSNTNHIHHKVEGTTALCSFCNKSVGYAKEIPCRFCNKTFCLTHRLESDHNCESIKTVQTDNLSSKEKVHLHKQRAKVKLAELKKKYNK